MIILSDEILVSLANPQSYERGRDYYVEGAVRKISRRAAIYEARVRGSAWYDLTINLSGTAPHGYCSCPYSYGGWCKHLVALGMAIIDRADEPQEEDLIEIMVADEEIPDFWNTVYATASSEQKERFLQELLTKNELFRLDFARFTRERQADKERTPDANLLTDISAGVYTDLSKLLIDEGSLYEYRDPHEYNRYGSYEEDWLSDALTEVLQETLEPYLDYLRKALGKGNTFKGLAILLAIYEGLVGIEKAKIDTYDEIEDVRQKAIECWYEGYKLWEKAIRAAILNVQDVKDMIRYVFDRFSYHEQNNTNPQAPSTDRFNWDDLFPICIGLVQDKTSAHYLDTCMQAYELPFMAWRELSLHVAKHMEDPDKTVEIWERNLSFSSEYAENLLAHYEKKGKKEDYIRVATQVFEQYAYGYFNQLLEALPKMGEQLLYRKVLRYAIEKRDSFAAYQIWKTLVSDDEKEALIEAVEKSFNRQLHLKIMEAEGRWEKIRELAASLSKIELDILPYFRPILQTYPQFCYFELAERVQYNLESARSRDIYKICCNWMKTMKEMGVYSGEVQGFILEIYKQKKPALKEEMRRAGLV